jgi:hypothetical protein
MSSKGFRERVLEVYEDGPALATSTTETSLLPASAHEFTVGAGRIRIGTALAFEFSGRISTLTAAPGTLSLALRLGTTDILASAGIPLNTTAQTNVHWALKGELICRAVGLTTVTTFFPKGITFTSRAVIGSSAAGTAGVGTELLPYNTAPAVGTGIDDSLSQLLDFMATWSVSNAANSIQLHAGHVDVYTQ